MSKYTLVDARDQRRLSFETLGEMLATWFEDPRRHPVTAGLSEADVTTIENVLSLWSRLCVVTRDAELQRGLAERRADSIRRLTDSGAVS